MIRFWWDTLLYRLPQLYREPAQLLYNYKFYYTRIKAPERAAPMMGKYYILGVARRSSHAILRKYYVPGGRLVVDRAANLQGIAHIGI